MSKYDFEKIYESYPRKMGKKIGLQRCEKKIKTDDDYRKLMQSVINYAAYTSNTDQKYIKHFCSFMSCWEDYIDLYAERSPQEKMLHLFQENEQKMAQSNTLNWDQ